MSCINAVVNKVNHNIVVRTNLCGVPISILCNKKSFTPNIICSFVCSSGECLQVYPETIQWISEFIPVEYLVKSNTNWVVYT